MRGFVNSENMTEELEVVFQTKEKCLQSSLLSLVK